MGSGAALRIVFFGPSRADDLVEELPVHVKELLLYPLTFHDYHWSEFRKKYDVSLSRSLGLL